MNLSGFCGNSQLAIEDYLFSEVLWVPHYPHLMHESVKFKMNWLSEVHKNWVSGPELVAVDWIQLQRVVDRGPDSMCSWLKSSQCNCSHNIWHARQQALCYLLIVSHLESPMGSNREGMCVVFRWIKTLINQNYSFSLWAIGANH